MLSLSPTFYEGNARRKVLAYPYFRSLAAKSKRRDFYTKRPFTKHPMKAILPSVTQSPMFDAPIKSKPSPRAPKATQVLLPRIRTDESTATYAGTEKLLATQLMGAKAIKLQVCLLLFEAFSFRQRKSGQRLQEVACLSKFCLYPNNANRQG
ncbi:MAG: hypothetical protein IJW87_01955 [Clostridia bacterium]|nr:hypothetical protein [Clostridia bacterium]